MGHRLLTDIEKSLEFCRFSKKKDKEKYYRELIMLYTSWRDEDTQLCECSTSFEEKYFRLKDVIDPVQAQYEPYSVELDAAEANIVQYNH